MPPKQTKLNFGQKMLRDDETDPNPKTETKKATTEAAAKKKAAAPAAAADAHLAFNGGRPVELLDLITDPLWKEALTPIIKGPLGAKIEAFLNEETIAKKKEVFPAAKEIFTAINVLPLDKVKVVLIGQDPYHDNDQAHGLCFSVKPGIKPPPSLVNMYKELAADISGFKAPTSHGYLLRWAKEEGILMLNATLTVEAHQANSHAKCGWQELTDEMIKIINTRCENVVFLLWGGFAQKKGKIIDTKKHTALSFAHPSPLSAKLWHGCKTFSKCNEALVALGKTPVNWSLPLEVSGE